MRTGADAALHHGDLHAALAQGADHGLAGYARAVGLEKDEVGFGLLHLDAGNLRKSARQRAGVGVILRQPVDMMVERVGAGGGANAGLAHRSAESLLPAPDLIDEVARARDNRTDRRT